MTDDDNEIDNVLTFTKRFDENADIKAQRNLIREAAPRCPIRCASILVNEMTRTLTCRRCGRVMEPFDWILDRTRDEEQVDWMLTGLRREIADRREGLKKLKVAESNAKSRVRYAEQKAARIEKYIETHSDCGVDDGTD